jgi:hypothetical protein
VATRREPTLTNCTARKLDGMGPAAPIEWVGIMGLVIVVLLQFHVSPPISEIRFAPRIEPFEQAARRGTVQIDQFWE